MSVAALDRAAASPFWLRRLAAAAAGLALVTALVLLLAWLAARLGAPPPAPARNPFGIGPREAAPAASGLGAVLLAWQSQAFTALRTALTELRASGGMPWALLAIGFGYGVVHAAGPGHGKAVIASYLLANGRRIRSGLAISTAAALVQAGVATLLVAGVFLVARGTAATLTGTAETVETVGFALLAALGAWLVWRKAGRLAAALGPERDVSIHAACAGCEPVRAGGAGGFREGAAVALAAGIRPCAGAIVVMTFAAAQGLVGVGLAAVLAMAAGTAITTGALAALAVWAKRTALRLAARRGPRLVALGPALELAAASLVLVLGLALLLGARAGGV